MAKVVANIEVIEMAESFNQEYIDCINSRTYHYGEVLCQYMQYIHDKNYKELIENVKVRIKFKMHRNKYRDKICEKEIPKYNIRDIIPIFTNKRIAVFSCITGGYDVLQEPLFNLENVDYLMFSDSSNKIPKDSVWKFRPIPERLNRLGNAEKNRYIKMHPFEFLQDYDYGLYIDGNIKVISHPAKFIAGISKIKSGLAMHHHRFRNCVYKEANACKLYRKGNILKIKEQIKRYKNEGFPSDWGLLEANVIAIDLNNESAKRILAAWWRELQINKSGRDQLAFPYVLWKLGYDISDIGCLGNDVTKNCAIRVVRHNSL